MEFPIAHPGNMPVYEFIKRELRVKINSGELSEGDRVPSEFELVRQLGVSRNQTRQALRDLELEGYLIRHPGKGSFVAPASMRLRRLATPGVKLVAMAASGLTSAYRRTVIEAFAKRMFEAGFHTLTSFLECTEEAEHNFLASIGSTGILGLAIWVRHTSDAMKAVLTTYRDAAFPFVLCDRYIRGFEADFVGSDNEEIGYALTKALIDRGHRQIAFITHTYEKTTTLDRLDGYRRALEENGIPFVEGLCGAVGEKVETAGPAVKGVLAYIHHPTALVCVDDGVARRVYNVLRELQYSVPDDMALAMVDDQESELNELGGPLIVARQAAASVGIETADMLLARIANPLKPIEYRRIQACRLPMPTREIADQQRSGAKGGECGKFELERVAEAGTSHSTASVGAAR